MYSFFDRAEFLELGPKSAIVGVPCKATEMEEKWLAGCHKQIGADSPDEEFRHGEGCRNGSNDLVMLIGLT